MTAQAHEILIYKGKLTSMACCPMIPDNHPRIQKVPAENFAFSTAYWRQYEGTWKIKYKRFYLVDIYGCYSLLGEEPLFADWFSGVLRIPSGEMARYIHEGFMSTYKQEVHIKVECGIVTKTRVVDNPGPRGYLAEF